MICLPVKTCASNCADILDSSFSNPSAALNIPVKLAPTFAASTAAFANPSAPIVENAANFSAELVISPITLLVDTPAAFAKSAATLETLVAASNDNPSKSINVLFSLTTSLLDTPAFCANFSMLAAFATVIFSNEPN